jgi:hypothetical protein
MKKIKYYLIAIVTLLALGVLGANLIQATSEGPKEAITNPQGAQTGGATSAEPVKGPVDSADVIPKGPQWMGAPIMPGGTPLTGEPTRQNYELNLPYAQVLAWYKEALKRYPDARYRDWKEEMYIEDQGGSKWHAIIISKTGGPKTTVTLVKDNWTWIWATLVIRFIGVFVVLLVLWMGLNIAGFFIQRLIKEEKTTAKA